MFYILIDISNGFIHTVHHAPGGESARGGKGDLMGLFKDIFTKAAAPVAALSAAEQLAVDTALLRAVEFNEIDNIKAALAKGANINARAPNTNDTALMIACREDDRDEAVNLLLDQKPDLTLTNSFQQTALHIILREHGNDDSAIRMIKAKAPLDVRDMHGATPAFWAAQNGRTDVMQELVDHKADLKIPNKDGQLPLMHASKLPHAETVAVMLKLDSGIDAQDTEGMTGLMWSILLHKPKQALLYIETGCNIELKDKEGNKAFDFAKKEGMEEVAAALRAKAEKNMSAIFEGAPVNRIRTVRFAAKPPANA